MKTATSIKIGILFALTGITWNCYAQWSSDPSVNTAISTEYRTQTEPQITSDGSSGAIIVWGDNRTGSSWDIYAQRINASGVVQWTVGGVAICTVAQDQTTPNLIPDGSGGAFITWFDSRNGNNDIYAQRINASGAVQWTANGVAICTNTYNKIAFGIITDCSGGAIIIWQQDEPVWDPDCDDGLGCWRADYFFYAQRINASGVAQWTARGAGGSPRGISFDSDGNGGAFISWDYYDIGVSRVSASGTVLWTTSLGSVYDNRMRLIYDGNGGAIVSWGYGDIYAQRVNASGTKQWGINGIVVCTAVNYQVNPQLISDGNGGAIIFWNDARSYTFEKYDIYSQRVDASGTTQWTANGVAISTIGDVACCSGAQRDFSIVSDGSGGGIIVFADGRTGVWEGNIYVQRINASGAVQWTINGVAVCTAGQNQQIPKITISTGCSAIIAWYDWRNNTSEHWEDGNDIYAQQIDCNGILAGTVLPIELLSFDATLLFNKIVLCQWATATEINNDYFTIERSRDTKFCVPVCSQIGTVKGAGNSTAVLHYEFIDSTPFLNGTEEAGVLYYRLKQTDYNGQSSYSAPVAVIFKGLEFIDIMPDVEINTLKYVVVSLEETKVNIGVMDVLGRKIIINSQFAYTGTNQFDLDISKLNTGMYFLQITTGSGLLKTQKIFVK